MTLDETKIGLVTDFLQQSFVGCSVDDWEDEEEDSLGQSYRIVDETSGKLLHRVFVARAFLDHHAEAEIVPALQDLAVLECLRIAGGRYVTVRSQTIEIEVAARSSSLWTS
jgi:hypothetical protein